MTFLAIIALYHISDVIPKHLPDTPRQDRKQGQGKRLFITILRLVQYATLHSQDHPTKGATHNVYLQMRRTRKVLRFLRTLQYSSAIRKDISEWSSYKNDTNTMALNVLTILENLFTLLFYLFDHRVFLGELEIISKDAATRFYPLSMKMYLLQNVFGALRSIMEAVVIMMEGKYQGEMVDMDNGATLIRNRGIQFLRNILDIFVALYYLRQPKGKATRAGIIGFITSIISLKNCVY